MTVNVINNSISKFQDECRVVNMKHEYPGYTGTVKWIVVSDLTEAQLNERYPKEMKEHSPYIYMTRLEFRPIVESHSNDRKHEMRKANSYDAYSYEDGTFEAFHPELVVHPFDGTDYESTLQYFVLCDWVAVPDPRWLWYLLRGSGNVDFTGNSCSHGAGSIPCLVWYRIPDGSGRSCKRESGTVPTFLKIKI